MEEEEFISDKDVNKSIEKFSVEELIDYKKSLLVYVRMVEEAINRRLEKKKEADKYFK